MSPPFEDIAIVDLDLSKTTWSRVHSAMRTLYLRLSRDPEVVWAKFFHEERESRIVLNRHGLWIEDGYIVFDCLLEDVETSHLPDFRLSVAYANEKYREFLAARRDEGEQMRDDARVEQDELAALRALIRAGSADAAVPARPAPPRATLRTIDAAESKPAPTIAVLPIAVPAPTIVVLPPTAPAPTIAVLPPAAPAPTIAVLPPAAPAPTIAVLPPAAPAPTIAALPPAPPSTNAVAPSAPVAQTATPAAAPAAVPRAAQAPMTKAERIAALTAAVAAAKVAVSTLARGPGAVDSEPPAEAEAASAPATASSDPDNNTAADIAADSDSDPAVDVGPSSPPDVSAPAAPAPAPASDDIADFNAKREEWRARFRAALAHRPKEPARGND